jgi:hypothetical protein
MNTTGWVVTITAMALMLVIPVSYLCLRLSARSEQLRNLFTLPGILKAYLTSRGRYLPQRPNETDENHQGRLAVEFRELFRTELSREYGRLRYAVAIIVAWLATALVIYLLATGSTGRFLSGAQTNIPSPLEFGLLGAFAYNLLVLLSGYETLDLLPSAFYWVPFRYVIAVIAGLLGSTIFKESGVPILFAFIAPSIPYQELLNYIRTFIPKLAKSENGGPSVWKIQGMHQLTVYRLGELGIHTTQELAYSDPLTLLFLTNFSPKVVIDWIDQALLYDYVGESINELRKRGIRGSIEMSHAKGNADYNAEIAKVMNVSETEVEYLIDKLTNDYQVQLLSRIWDVFSA